MDDARDIIISEHHHGTGSSRFRWGRRGRGTSTAASAPVGARSDAHRRRLRRRVAGGCLVPALAIVAGACTAAEQTWQAGIEHYRPIYSDRQIELTAARLALEYASDRWPLAWRGSLTAFAARGHITQLTGRLEEGTLRSVTLTSDAYGGGAGIGAALGPLRMGALGIRWDIEESLLLSDRGFPAGGRHYNFMFETGPTLSLSAGGMWSLGGRWTHVSNGSGVGPRNPSYEGIGVVLAYTWR